MSIPAIEILLIGCDSEDLPPLRSKLNTDPLSSFSIAIAENLGDGLILLEKSTFDIVLLSLSLSKRQGFSAVEQIREQSPETPVIICAQKDNQQQVLQAIQAGAQDYVFTDSDDFHVMGRIIRQAIEHQKLTCSLQESENRFHTFFEQSQSGLILLDEQGKISDWNRTQEKLTGIPKEKALGQPYWEIQFLLMTPNDRSGTNTNELKAAWQNTLITGQLGDSDQPRTVEILATSGEQRLIQTKSFLLKTRRGYRVGSTFRDITAQRQVVDELNESEQRFARVFHSSPVCQLIVTMESGQILDINDAFCSLAGYAREEVINQTTSELNFWVNPIEMQKMLVKLRSDGRVREMEADFRNHSGEIHTLLISFEPITLMGMKCVISTGIDITQRKQAEKGLRESEQNLRAFFDTIDHLLFVLDLQGNILLANKTATQALGYSLDELKGQSVLRVHPPERWDEAERIIKEMLAGQTDSCPVPLLTKTGRQIPVETRVAKGTWSGQEVIFGVTKDLSTLKASEEMFSKIFHVSPALMAISELNTGKYVDVNETFLRTLGLKRKEVIGTTALELNLFVDPSQRTLLLERLDRQGYLRNEDVPVRTKSGEVRYGVFFAEYVRLQDQNLLLTVMNDITERREIETELQLINERFRILVEQIPAIVYIDDATQEPGRTIYISPQIERILGIAQNEWLEGLLDFWLSHIHPEDRDRTLANYLQFLENGQQIDMEYRMIATDGHIVWFRDQAVMVYNPKSASKLIHGVMHDISERKRAEKARLENEEKLQKLIETTPDAIGVFDATANITMMNPAAAVTFGYSTAAEMVGLSALGFFMPEDHEKAQEVIQKIFSDGTIRNAEFRLIKKDGTSFTAEFSCSALYDSDGTPTGIIAITRDITGRKQTLDLLSESEERYRSLVETTESAVASVDAEGRFIFMNRAAALALGSAPETLIGKRMGELFPSDVAEFQLEAIRQVIASGKGLANDSVSVIQGEPHWFHTSVQPIHNADGQILSALVNSLDITERKRAEDAVRASETHFRSLFENIPVGVLLADLQGNILEVNPASLSILGSPSATATQKINVLTFQPLVEAGISADFQECVQTARPLSSEHHYLTKWGKSLDMNMRFTPVVETSEKPMLIQILLEDVTERKQAEKKLRTALEEKDSLLHEVHHRVKNNLQVMISLMEMRSGSIQDEATLIFLKELEGQARTMALVYEQLYQSVNLARVEMAPYIEQLTSNLLEIFGEYREIELNINADTILDVAEAMPCGLIINELFTNILKYAFPPDFQGKPSILIDLRQAGKTCRLIISDNGVGLKPGFDLRNSQSMGTYLVNLWATHQLGGTLTIAGQPGTTFTIVFETLTRR